MKLNKAFLALTLFIYALTLAVMSYAQVASEDPTQLGARQLEVRHLDVNYDMAYRSATQALLSLGYAIGHSDKTSGILTGSRMVGVSEMREEVKRAKEEMKEYQEQARNERVARTALGFVPYVGWLAGLLPGSRPPDQRDFKEPSKFLVTMLLQPLGKNETQIRFKMQKDGEPVWDQTTIDRLWVTTQREAMIESGPPQSNPSAQQGAPPTSDKVAPTSQPSKPSDKNPAKSNPGRSDNIP